MAAAVANNGHGGMNGNGQTDEEEEVDLEQQIIQGRSGKVTGIIYPPPDIRAVVDKTAQWCVRVCLLACWRCVRGCVRAC